MDSASGGKAFRCSDKWTGQQKWSSEQEFFKSPGPILVGEKYHKDVTFSAALMGDDYFITPDFWLSCRNEICREREISLQDDSGVCMCLSSILMTLKMTQGRCPHQLGYADLSISGHILYFCISNLFTWKIESLN